MCVYFCNFIRLIYLQVTRNMVLFLLFNHTHTSVVEGISLIDCILSTPGAGLAGKPMGAQP